ncbi:hypothetical protein ACWD7F_39620 [Streptomyces sp. NPDC005122]
MWNIDNTIRRTYCYAKQGTGYGYLKVKGLNALFGIISTPLAAPVIAATRLRKGPANSARGAAAFVAETIRATRASGATGLLVVRADSRVLRLRRGERLPGPSRTFLDHGADERLDQGRHRDHRRGRLDGDQVSPGRLGRGGTVLDLGRRDSRDHLHRLHLQAEEAAGHRPADRASRQTPGTDAVSPDQGTLFDTWRYHAAFTNSPLALREAERDHRRHAVVEQVIADVKNSAFAHAPSGHFQANAAWLALAALAHNLTRAAGTLAGAFHARAVTATIRAHLINVSARLPAPPAASPSTCPNAGPGRTTSRSCSPHCTRHHAPPDAPWPIRPQGPETEGHVEKLGRPAAITCPNPRITHRTIPTPSE